MIFSLVKRKEAAKGSSNGEGNRDALEIALQPRETIEERPLAGKIKALLLVEDDLYLV
jgi:hypothetical protein